MADQWISLTLGDVFINQFNALETLLAEVSSAQNKFNAMLNDINNKIASANAALSSTLALLSYLDESGFYILYMPPDSGGLITRIGTATNGPNPNLNYSCGIVFGATSINLLDLATPWKNLLKTLNKDAIA